MRSVLVKIAVNAVAIWVAAAVVPGVDVSGAGTAKTIATLAVVGALFGLVNAFIKPVVKLFSFPFYILTLGLFAFVVNALGRCRRGHGQAEPPARGWRNSLLRYPNPWSFT